MKTLLRIVLACLLGPIALAQVQDVKKTAGTNVLATSPLVFSQTGLGLLDTDGTNYLLLKNGANLAATRSLTLTTTGDTSLTLPTAGTLINTATVDGYFGDPSTNSSFSAIEWRSDMGLLNSIASTSGNNLSLTGNSGVTFSIGHGASGIFQFKDASSNIVSTFNPIEPVLGLTGPGRWFIGTNTPSGDNSAVLIGRNLVGSQVAGAHGFRDETTYTPSGAGLQGYASYDSIPSLNGSGNNLNHIASFQSRIQVNSSTNLPNLQGYTFQTTHNGTGTIAQNIGFYIDDALGTGPITSNIGIYFAQMSRGAGNFSIYSSGSQQSYHAGLWQVGILQSDGQTTIGGANASSEEWGASGIRMNAPAKTYTDTSTAASGTAALETFISFGVPTLAALNSSVTTTKAVNVYIAGDPVSGSNQTISNSYSLEVNGKSLFDGTSKFLGSVDIGNTVAGNRFVTTNGAGVLAAGSALTYSGNNLSAAGNFSAASGYGVFGGSLSAFTSSSGGIYNYYSGGGFVASYSDNSGTLAQTIIDGSTVILRPGGSSAQVTATTSGTTVSGNLTVNAVVIDSTDTLSGPGAISINKTATKLTSTGVGNAVTLANGVDGQIKRIIHEVDGGSAVLTPTTKTGFSTVTFTNAGESVTLEYIATSGWIVVGSYGVTIAP